MCRLLLRIILEHSQVTINVDMDNFSINGTNLRLFETSVLPLKNVRTLNLTKLCYETILFRTLISSNAAEQPLFSLSDLAIKMGPSRELAEGKEHVLSVL